MVELAAKGGDAIRATPKIVVAVTEATIGDENPTWSAHEDSSTRPESRHAEVARVEHHHPPLVVQCGATT
jgi:hypothetical protein